MLNRLVLIIALCFMHFQVHANEVYIIKNIKISGNNKIASIARNEAIEAGQLKAFRGLVKLHYSEALDKVSQIEKDDIFSLVESYELSDEKRSVTHYSAKLKVIFSRQHVDQLMNNLGVYFSENKAASIYNEEVQSNKHDIITDDLEKEHNTQASLPPTLTTLVVPVYINQNNEYWFDDINNQWLKFLQQKDVDNKFVLPVADLEDLILLNNKILHKNLIDLAPLLDKYNVNNIAIYTLEDLIEEKSQNHIVSLRVNYINRFHYSWQSHSFSANSGQDLSKLLEKAYSQMQEFNFANNEENQNISFNEVDLYAMTVEYSVEKISDWVYLQKVLAGVSYIEAVKLNKINRKNYNFSFNAKVSIEDLIKLFKQRGFILEQRDNKFYLVKDYPNEEN